MIHDWPISPSFHVYPHGNFNESISFIAFVCGPMDQQIFHTKARALHGFWLNMGISWAVRAGSPNQRLDYLLPGVGRLIKRPPRVKSRGHRRWGARSLGGDPGTQSLLKTHACVRMCACEWVYVDVWTHTCVLVCVHVCMYVCVCMCVHVCMYVSTYLCIIIYVSMCLYVAMYVGMCVCMYVSMCLYTYLCIIIYVSMCLYVAMYVCMYVCVYVCMYLCL